jgi:hypothetical protein
MHERGEETARKFGQVQCREFLASLKPVFVNSAFVVAQKMAGHAVHDHQPVAPFFEVLLVERFARFGCRWPESLSASSPDISTIRLLQQLPQSIHS